jgi:molybdate transport system substrate-binding protein
MKRLLAGLLCLCLTMPVMAEQIRVAAAISMKETLADAATEFKAETGNDVQFAFGASGALAAQIKNSKNTDVFVSAADKQMNDLQAEKLIDADTRRVIATNELVLVVPTDSANVPAGFMALADATYKKIAVGEPRTVPAGDYAVQLLHTLKLFDAVKDRLVYGENVRQVLVYVERGEVDAGIVYSTDAKEAGGHVKVAATADPKDHSPINYPAAVIAGSEHAQTAAKFLDFLSSDAGKKILAAHGFIIPVAATNP